MACVPTVTATELIKANHLPPIITSGLSWCQCPVQIYLVSQPWFQTGRTLLAWRYRSLGARTGTCFSVGKNCFTFLVSPVVSICSRVTVSEISTPLSDLPEIRQEVLKASREWGDRPWARGMDVWARGPSSALWLTDLCVLSYGIELHHAQHPKFLRNSTWNSKQLRNIH